MSETLAYPAQAAPHRRDGRLFQYTIPSVIFPPEVKGKSLEIVLDIVEDAVNFHGMGEQRVVGEFMGHAQTLSLSRPNRRTSTEVSSKRYQRI